MDHSSDSSSDEQIQIRKRTLSLNKFFPEIQCEKRKDFIYKRTH